MAKDQTAVHPILSIPLSCWAIIIPLSNAACRGLGTKAARVERNRSQRTGKVQENVHKQRLDNAVCSVRAIANAPLRRYALVASYRSWGSRLPWPAQACEDIYPGDS